MQIALRRGFGYAYNPLLGMAGLGDCGDGTDPAYDAICMGTVTSTDPNPLLTDESGNSCLSSMFVNGQCPQSADPSLLFGGPTNNYTGAPAPVLTPTELAAEQARATSWLATIPGALTTAAKVGLTAAQIASGVSSGGLKASSTCPSGYMIAGSAQCAIGASAAGAPLIAGISNTTLGILAIAFIGLMMMGSGGGRRR